MKIGALVIDILYLVATNDVNLGMLGAEASSVGEEDKYSLDCPPIELQRLEDILSQNTRGLTWTQKCVISRNTFAGQERSQTCELSCLAN